MSKIKELNRRVGVIKRKLKIGRNEVMEPGSLIQKANATRGTISKKSLSIMGLI